jgi:nitroreductase
VNKPAFLDILRRRHACHGFIPGREISDEDMAFILEAGRLSPSSFGMEPWKFMVVYRHSLKAGLRSACFNQPQVESASVVLLVLARLREIQPGSAYVTRQLTRENDAAGAPQAELKYAAFAEQTDMRNWAITQCHIAAANMMNAAAAIGIDSCAIGGFDEDQVIGLLGLDTQDSAVALVIPFGYCAQSAPPKLRQSLADMVEYR